MTKAMTMPMPIQIIPAINEELVVIRRRDFESLMEKAGVLPARPKPDNRGTVDAFEAIDVSIARRLITDRIRRGWTQTELARRSGVRLETISRLETGKRAARQETLVKLERALGSEKGS